MREELHPDLLVRYQDDERLSHWLTVIAFAFAACSGLALFHPALYFLAFVLGGGPWATLLHPFAGLLMCATFFRLARRLWPDNRLEARDWQWLRAVRAGGLNSSALPEVGRYNAGQKLMIRAFLACLVVLLASGIVIWRAYFASYFPVTLLRLGALLHALAAFVLVSGVIVHVLAALRVRGSLHAMTRGTVTLGWAFKHHRAWFRERIRSTSGR